MATKGVAVYNSSPDVCGSILVTVHMLTEAYQLP